MESQNTDNVTQIIELLKFKAVAKQKTYRGIQEVFKRMKNVAADFAGQIDKQIHKVDDAVDVEFIDVSDFEFQMKFSGDVLVFSMHSNIVTFPKEHILFKSPYIQQDMRRSFFGAIVAYNFLADSLRYKRMADPGYLIGRMFVNIDDHFYMEGVRQWSFLFPDISQNKLEGDQILLEFIQSSMIAAMEIDSEMPPFENEKMISVHQKLNQRMLGNIQKVGFKTGLNPQ